jgi:probable HAF family extracellular repeat protein
MGASFQGLGDLSGGSFISSASGVSADGSVVVGYGYTASGQQAFRWASTEGMVGLGTFEVEALYYSTAIRNLKSVLTDEYGLDLTGWTLLSANDISPDGNVIVGEGVNPSGQNEAFLIVLVPEPATIIQLVFAAMLLGLFGIRRLRRRV